MEWLNVCLALQIVTIAPKISASSALRLMSLLKGAAHARPGFMKHRQMG